jgi:hypothetical protein
MRSRDDRLDGGRLLGHWAAANNVDSRSRGPWPLGASRFQAHHPHADEASPDSAYGLHGILVFAVAGREGMGVHSGCRRVRDRRLRWGVNHCTMGCIRTTDEAMAAILAAHAADPLTAMFVVP